MSANRKFQFKSRVRLNTAQNALRNVSTEPIYSSSDLGDTASELSISVIDVKAPVNENDSEGDNETIVDGDDVLDENKVKVENIDNNVLIPKINDDGEILDAVQVSTSLEIAQTSNEMLDTNLTQSHFFPSATRIVIEEAEPNSPGSISLSSAHFDETLSEMDALSRNRLSSFNSREEDAQSRISFIVKERLHEFAKDIRRRTSQVRDEVVREPTPDSSEAETASAPGGGGAAGRERQQASLMSLIGLRQGSNGQVEDEEDESACCGISKFIDPFGQRYKAWLFFVVSALLYNAFMIPLRSSYPYQNDENLVWWLIVDYTCDFIYLIDLVVVKPRLTFMRGGITIKKPSEMLKNYLHSKKFKLDLLSLLPLDLFYFVTGPVSAWRMVRVLKLSCFWEFFDLLDSSFSNPYVIRIAKTFSYMIYIIHCNSCIYYVLSAWQAFGQIPYVYKGKYHLNKWVYNNEGNAYIRCFYFTAAVATSTGNNPSPTNVIEYIYMTFSWMMGVFVFALLLGQIRDIVSNANKNNEEFRTTMDKALGECKRLDLPEHLTARVRSWFLYTWEQQKTLDEKKLVEKLPLKLQTDLALSVHYNTLSKVQLFQDADRALLRDLVLKLRPVIFLPNDMICRKGDVGKEMYIVNNGILEVVGGDSNEIVFATLKEGSVFGEISLLAIGGNNRRTANIRSKGYSTLFVLSKEDLNDVIKDYPDAQHLMRRKARQLLQKDVSKRAKGDAGDAEADQAKRDLTEKCRVSSDLRTPRMLAAVAKLMPPHSNTSKILSEALERKHEEDHRRGGRRRLQRWSTIPAEFSDLSDIENTSQALASPSFLSKTKSLDV